MNASDKYTLVEIVYWATRRQSNTEKWTISDQKLWEEAQRASRALSNREDQDSE